MCTRVFNSFNEKNHFLTTARNMDWEEQFPTSLYAFKVDTDSEMIKSGTANRGEDTLVWTAKYSTIIAMVGDDSTEYAATDGINDKGLVANLLYDSGANYRRKDASSCEKLDVLRWLQYVLDTCSSVDEVVEKFNKESKIQLVGGKVPGSDKPASGHLSVSDSFGDSAIIEVNHEFIPYHNEQFRVMTNDPDYAKQIELNQFWRWQWNENENKFPSNTLPGTPFSADRFARASYYLNNLHPVRDTNDSLAQSKSVVMNASVPVNFKSPNREYPNIAQTLWTTLAAHSELKYYFCNAHTAGNIWVDMKKMDAFPAPVSRLEVVRQNQDLSFTNEPLYGFKNSEFEKTTDPFVAE